MEDLRLYFFECGSLIHSAAVASSTRKVRRAVEGLGATLVTGHDPEEWPKFKKAPEYYA